MNDVQPLNDEISTLKITPESREYLEETSKWGRVIGITGYLFSSMIVLFAMMTLFSFGTEGGGEIERAFQRGVVISSLVMAILLLLPSYFIFNFSKKIKNGLISSDSDSMALAMKDLKSTFRFYGIFIILGVMLYMGLTIFIVNYSSNYNSSF